MNEIENYKQFISLLAGQSASVIRKYFRAKPEVESKKDLSPVTVADRKAEEVMRELIMKEYPSHGIIGEEFGNYNESAEYQWVLDPIDGTKSFISGALSFGTLIALLKNGEPVIGAFNQPVLNEFLIGDGTSALLNGREVRTRQCNSIEQATLLVTDHLDVAKYQKAAGYENLIRKVKLYRNWGDCYGYYLLATGFADIMIDPVMHPWDLLALIPIIRGAGGIITDYQGNDPVKGNSIVATSADINKAVLEMLNPD